MPIYAISRQQRLQFRPPLEEIRAKYFREMKKFISIPNHFKGVGDATENLIFPAIIDRNGVGLITCYKKTGDLFRRLEKAADKFKVCDCI
jgi:dynein heavy chain 2